MGVPRRYSSVGSANVGTAKSIVTLVSASNIRPGMYHAVIGCAATPGDQASKFYLARFTAAGTPGASPTPQALDPGDPASLCSSGSGGGTAFSAEPTYTAGAILAIISGNQRNTLQFWAGPGYELVAPATAANGIGLYSATATGTAVHDATIFWIE